MSNEILPSQVLIPTVFAVTESETYKLIEGLVPHQETPINASHSGITARKKCASLCLLKTGPKCLAFTFDKSGQFCDLYSEPIITITESLDSNQNLYTTQDGKNL